MEINILRDWKGEFEPEIMNNIKIQSLRVWEKRLCVVYMSSLYWNIIERNILKIRKMPRRYPGSWITI